MSDDADLVVLGAGPAGSISALLAAREGLRVVLVDPGKALPRIEGLSPRLHRWLEGQGLLGDFYRTATSGFAGPLRRETDWSGLQSAGNAEFVVDRAAFDHHLRTAAVAAGARLVDGSSRPCAQGVELTDGRRIEAGRVIDARGRASGRAGRAGDRAARAPATLSICGWAEAEGIAPGIRISAIRQGWVWRACFPDGQIWLQFTGDASGQGGIEVRLRAAFSASEPGLGVSRLLGKPIARESAPLLPASLDECDGLGVLPVGDAFAAMDPLSGHGQFWAVSSALAVAAVRRTLAERPGIATERLCRLYLETRAAETYLRNARIGRDFIRAETRFADAPFWAARRAFPDDAPIHDVPRAITIDRAPVVNGGLIEEMDVLRTPRTPAGIAWFGDIPAAEAYRMLAEGGHADRLVARWGTRAGRLAQILEREARPL